MISSPVVCNNYFHNPCCQSAHNWFDSGEKKLINLIRTFFKETKFLLIKSGLSALDNMDILIRSILSFIFIISTSHESHVNNLTRNYFHFISNKATVNFYFHILYRPEEISLGSIRRKNKTTTKKKGELEGMAFIK